MTREDAIRWTAYVQQSEPWQDRVIEALDMAIEALEREPSDDLISRAEAIEAIENTDWYHQNQNKDMVHGANDDEHQARYKAQDIYKALEAVPLADRQMVIKCKPFLSEEDFKAFAEQASDQNVILISNEAEVVSTNTSTNTSTKSTNISTDTSADRPRGEWEEMGENKDGTHNIRCDQCGESFKARGHANSHNTKKKYRFCPSCGADMRSTEGGNDRHDK